MRRLIIASLIAIAAPVATLSAQGQHGPVRQETRELRGAKREVNRDQRERRQAVRDGDKAAAKQETREIRKGQRGVKQERRDVRRAVRNARPS